MARFLKRLPSRRGGFRWHEIWENEDGSLSCTCEARTKCWALQKVAAEIQLNKILGHTLTPLVSDMRERIDAQIAAAQQGFKEWAANKIEPTIEQIKAYNAVTLELHETSRVAYQQRYWKRFYAERRSNVSDIA